MQGQLPRKFDTGKGNDKKLHVNKAIKMAYIIKININIRSDETVTSHSVEEQFV
jgi:hypothetical protein